jgi:LPS O-antigen subunit length determinant protein (WzzB/FepE family)
MRSLVRWAARLYPAAWRARYGEEMEALLEDVGPGGGDLWDVLRGALFMQMTSLSFGKILAGCTLAGVLAAGVWSLAQPNRYVSTAVVRISIANPATGGPADLEETMGHMQAVQQDTFSRSSLASIIVQQNLYANERNRLPLEEVIREMRTRHLRMQSVNESGTAFVVSFENENPAAAQATLRAIVSSMAEHDVRVSKRQGNGTAIMEVLDPASLPAQPAGPNRMLAIGGGLGAGLVLGLACGAIWWITRRKGRRSIMRIGGFAGAGMALGLAVAFLIPNEYVSTAVLRTADGSRLPSTMAEVMSEDSLAAIIRRDHLYSRDLSRSSMHDVVRKMRDEYIRLQTVQVRPRFKGAAFTISFRYSDRVVAQTVTRDLVTRFITITGAPLSATDVIDSASLPQEPIYPNRLSMAVLGTVAGILLGLGVSLFRLAKLATA